MSEPNRQSELEAIHRAARGDWQENLEPRAAGEAKALDLELGNRPASSSESALLDSTTRLVNDTDCLVDQIPGRAGKGGRMRHQQRSWLFVLWVVALLNATTACGSDAVDTTSTQDGAAETTTAQDSGTQTTASSSDTSPSGLPQIGFAWTDPALEIFTPLQNGALAEGEERGYEVLFSNNGGDPVRQLADIQTWIGLGVVGLTIIPLDPDATGNLAAEAQEQGIVVVGYSTPIENQDGSTTFDHVQGGTELGQNAADWINENLDGNGIVGLLTIDIEPSGKARIDNFVEVIEAETNSEIVSRLEAVSAAEALPQVESMLQAHPDINVLACVADDGCLGASQAFAAAGVDPAGVWMGGWDGARGTLAQVLEGGNYVKAVAALDLFEIGRSVVYAPDFAINGGGDPHVVHQYLIVDESTPDDTQRLLDAYTPQDQ